MADALAQRIRQARVEAGLSREFLAGTIGVSLGTIARIESGRTTHFSANRLAQIAEVTGKPISWFFQDGQDCLAAQSM